MTMEQDRYSEEASKNARPEELMSKLSTACWWRLLLAVQRSSRGLHTTARQLQTCTFEGPGASNTTKISREHLSRERQKKRKCELERESNARNFGAPPFGAQPCMTHTRSRNGLAKIGQIRMAKTGLAKVGLFRPGTV